jgi:hypothetical protein
LALKTFTAGEVLTASDTNVYLKNTIFARKTATESVTSSTTFQDDDHLSVSVAASSVYEMTAFLKYDGDTAGDLKFQWVGPSGATLSFWTETLQVTASSTADDAHAISAISTAVSAGARGAGTNCAATMAGLLVVSTTAGTFKLQWSQDTSSATATRLFADSYVCLRRVD